MSNDDRETSALWDLYTHPDSIAFSVRRHGDGKWEYGAERHPTGGGRTLLVSNPAFDTRARSINVLNQRLRDLVRQFDKEVEVGTRTLPPRTLVVTAELITHVIYQLTLGRDTVHTHLLTFTAEEQAS